MSIDPPRHIKSEQAARNFLARKIYSIGDSFRQFYHFITKPERRAEVFTAWKYGNKYFQRSTYTESNRYPLLFRQCRLLLQHIKQPALLSYGCSTGEEVSSLSHYLPDARIMGVDINQRCIRICNEKNKNPVHVFYHTEDDRFIQAASFDAIFCMAVLQRMENRIHTHTEIAGGFTFETFEKEAERLHNKLRKGGYLFISHTDFSFEDTRFFTSYERVPFEGNRKELNRPLYGPDNRLKANKQFLYRCFVKISD